MAAFPESILVTGGAGFVGSNLALHLKTRHPATRVVALDNLHRRGSELNLPRLAAGGVEFVRGDIRYPDQFPAGPFACLIECSAEPSVLAGYGGSPDYLMETNLSGTYRCLEQARAWRADFLFLSTSRVYPIAALEGHPWREADTRFEWLDVPGAPISSRGVSEACPMQGARSLYGFTKFASEGLIEEYRAGFGLRAAINRCSVLAGPWQMGKVDQGVIALWVLRHWFGKPLQYIGYGGTGKQVRDALHVADLAELVEEQLADFHAWDGWSGNVGGGRDVSASLLELTALCREATGRQVPVGSESQTRTADLRLFLADCQRLFARTTWRPRRGMREIVGDLAVWVREHESLLAPLV